jgi:hypothetical protein
MARIEGMERRRTLVACLAFFLSRRSSRRVPMSGESDARADVVQPTGDRAVDRHPSALAFPGRGLPTAGIAHIAPS